MSLGQRLRYGVYAAAVTTAALLVLEAIFGWWVPPTRDEALWRPGVTPWVASDDGFYRPNPESPLPVAAHPFRVAKGDAWRVFFVGESFLRGVPYDEIGTIHGWLHERLLAGHPSVPVEVVNASMSAQNSARIRETVDFALEHHPDLLVVATCNNEGTLQPSAVTRALHDSGTFRALRSALRSGEALPTHTLQNPDTEAVRDAFRQNLRAIVESTGRRGVPLLLCTLPLNLRYDGDESGLAHAADRWEAPGTWSAPACVVPGRDAVRAGRHAEAIEALRGCEEAEALRWLGLAQAGLGDPVARRTLEQYVELMPRNRCRPSFQAVIREEARRGGHVTLVDLDARSRSRAPAGLPGSEDFTDYCHLRWGAQADVADALIEALDGRGLGPRGSGLRAPVPDRGALVEAARLAGTLRAPAEQRRGRR